MIGSEHAALLADFPMQGVRAVVGIVGSAHVPGMVRQWQDALASPRDVGDLLAGGVHPQPPLDGRTEAS
jgi:hypothetical protein